MGPLMQGFVQSGATMGSSERGERSSVVQLLREVTTIPYDPPPPPSHSHLNLKGTPESVETEGKAVM